MPLLQPPDDLARLPLAAAPVFAALALSIPGAIDPAAMLSTMPPLALLCAALAAAAPALTIATSRAHLPDADRRKRVLAQAGAAALAATAVTILASLSLAEALLVRAGGARVLFIASLLALCIVAGAVAVRPASRVLWGALAGELVVALALRAVFGLPVAPDEHVRHAMVVVPGWGRTSAGALLVQRLRGDGDVRARLAHLDAKLARMTEDGSFAPPFTAWGDDARVARAWIGLRLALASEDEASRHAAIRTSAHEEVLLAASPATHLEAFTAGGRYAIDPLLLTDGLGSDRDLRYRLGFAFEALTTYSRYVDDEAGEREAVQVMRSLFEKNGLDRTHGFYLATYGLERRRLLQKGDGDAFATYFEGVAKQDWPEDLRESFLEDVDFVRAHPEDGFVPVMLILKARLAAGEGDLAASAAAYKDLLQRFPTTTLASTARLESALLEKPRD